VTLNDELHAARDVQKTHTVATNAFASPGLGPLGYFDGDSIYLARKPARRLTLRVNAIEPRVTLIRLFAGSDGTQVRAAVAAGRRGIVLEVFGRGNVPPKVMDAVRDARAKNIAVVFTPRTGGGRVVLDDVAMRSGVVSGEDVDGLKARLVLVAALGTTSEPDQLQSYFRVLSGKLED
jgi:L-asparaginase